MLGFFVHHTSLKLGKICRSDQACIAVRFFADSSERAFERDAIDQKELSRTFLPLGTRCRLKAGHCRIDGYEGDIEPHRPVVYRVTTDEDLSRLVSEVDLEPVGLIREDPVTSLAGLHADGYALFQARSRLLNAHGEVIRQAGGLQALLASRIDVLPHQAYVAGVVLHDRVRRYILADEVGLGKTIEAGVVVQHLLSTNPGMRVLVLCPGALTQQWLCEFFSKFSNRVFTLLELYPSSADLPLERRRTVIAPLESVSGEHRDWMLETRWDLVIVDEVHHLLSSPEHYAFVGSVSRRAPGLLLLSALPAQQRKTEFLSLLALLDPDRYEGEPPEDFDQLFDAQTDIGRQLRRLRRRLEESDADPEEVREVAEDLVSLPALASDELLQARYRAVLQASAGRLEAGWQLLHDAASRARINRRILRNRRTRLVEEGLLAGTRRTLLLRPYEPGQPELDAGANVRRIVRALCGRLPHDAWSATARVLMQSLAHPETALETLQRLAHIAPTAVAPSRTLGHLAGSVGWPAYRDGLLTAARQYLTRRVVEDAVEAAKIWRDAASGLERVTFLADELERLERNYKKIVLFAGFPGLVDQLAPYLIEQFEPESLAVFRSDMGREEKEENVDRFRTDPDAWLLLCDESGGEGRNFQFAAAVLHYDTPWYVSRVEQRIGRLDRLGRGPSEVPSCVLVSLGTPEHDLVRCFADGLGVYTKSVSGLEFALHEIESELVRTLVGDGGTDVEGYLHTLRERSQEERGREEAEAVLDEASFNRDAAARYRQGEDLAEAEAELEPAFIDFLRKAGSGNAIRQHPDLEFPDALWDLDPSQLQHISAGLQPSGRATTGRFRGTFRRAVAQVRQDLDFFTVGHPFFDGVLASALSQPCGRVYAVDVDVPEEPTWAGFEFVLTAGPDLGAGGATDALARRAERLFARVPFHVFVDGAGQLVPNPERLLATREGLSRAGKEKTWWNLTKEKAARAMAAFPNSAWGEVVARAAAVATEEARRHFEEKFAPVIALEVGLLDEERLAAKDPADAAVLEAVTRAIRNWVVRIDAAGFLSVNGKLGRSR